MHKNTLPALAIVGAGIYLLMKLQPSSSVTAALKNAFANVQEGLAKVQAGPAFPIVTPRVWSDKSTSLYVEQTQTAAPTPPNISGDGMLRDSQALHDVLNIGIPVPVLDTGGQIS